ncbi:MAG: amidase [Rhodospirillaceae bacterium]|nr:amidase [Rhodospirillaceae bacterium]
MSNDLCERDLSWVAAAIADKTISAEEATRAAIARLETVGPTLHAVQAMDPDLAIDAARQADVKLARGQELGPLHGVPLAHKDMFYRKGRISGCGSKIRAEFVPDVTASVLAGLDRAGALDIARLNMVEFALGVTGHNEVTGTPMNPWNTAHITGGSSSGSGAAVAGRLIYGALGSDTGGSIRFPACCNGVVGMKPTWSRVSRFGAMPLSASLDTIGPLTRTVRDNALMFQAIAGHDPNDATSSRLDVPDYAAALSGGVKGLRVAVPENYFFEPVDDEIADLVRTSLDVLTDAGAEIIPVTVPESIRVTNAFTSLITATEGASIHQTWLTECFDDYGRQTGARLMAGLTTPATRYLQARSLRAPILAEFHDAVFTDADVLHIPVMISTPPTIADTDNADNPGFMDMITKMGLCTRPINYLGLPALTIPCGFTANGLPTAFQLVGRPFDEATLYRAGEAYQHSTDWHEKSPLPV